MDLNFQTSYGDRLKVLNLYAGIGGNRKYWDDVVDDLEVTAVEIDEEIAQVYQDNFPQDEVLVKDAHDFLENNYKKYDFIWSSPPCPTHSRVRNELSIGMGQNKAVYPDMDLYEEILLLKQVKKISGYDGSVSRKKLLRNCVHPDLGKHILECAVSDKVKKLDSFCRR